MWRSEDYSRPVCNSFIGELFGVIATRATSVTASAASTTASAASTTATASRTTATAASTTASAATRQSARSFRQLNRFARHFLKFCLLVVSQHGNRCGVSFIGKLCHGFAIWLATAVRIPGVTHCLNTIIEHGFNFASLFFRNFQLPSNNCVLQSATIQRLNYDSIQPVALFVIQQFLDRGNSGVPISLWGSLTTTGTSTTTSTTASWHCDF
jgi:hypothetical protein